MEFLIFSDTHYDKNPKKSYTLENGMSSWLQTQMYITADIFEYADQHNIKTIFHLGDLFERKNHLPQDLYNTIWDFYKEQSGFDIILNVGNHDRYKVDDTSLLPFSQIISVHETPHIIERDDCIIKIVPHNNFDFELPETDKTKILMLHHEIDGFQYNRFTNVESEIKVNEFSCWDYVFSGHIHTPQTLQNIVCVGSTNINDWGEIERTRRFIHFKDGNYKSIMLNHPLFIEMEDIPNKVGDYDFYRVNISKEELSNDIFKKYNVSPNITKMKERSSRLKAEEKSDKEILAEYIDSIETELDMDKLMKIGMKIMEE